MTRANERKFHYIYKITRTDGKYYIGLHSTDDLEDEYFGSGQLLWKSIKKHGKEKHSKEILEFLPSRTALRDRERELVNLETIKDPLCLNRCPGGEGGFIPASITPEARSKAVETLRTNGTSKGWAPAYKQALGRGKTIVNGMSGKKHTTAAKDKMSSSASGEKNSQFGKTAYVNPDTGERKMLFNRPENWKTPAELNEERKDKKNNTYGKRWYNDSINNYLLSPTVKESKHKDLVPGRLRPGFKKTA